MEHGDEEPRAVWIQHPLNAFVKSPLNLFQDLRGKPRTADSADMKFLAFHRVIGHKELFVFGHQSRIKIEFFFYEETLTFAPHRALQALEVPCPRLKVSGIQYAAHTFAFVNLQCAFARREWAESATSFH
jgi:hypothetical protein